MSDDRRHLGKTREGSLVRAALVRLLRGGDIPRDPGRAGGIVEGQNQRSDPTFLAGCRATPELDLGARRCVADESGIDRVAILIEDTIEERPRVRRPWSHAE